MNLIHFEPFSLMHAIERDFDRFAGRNRGRDNGETRAADWAPAVDIVENDDRFVLRADLPGVAAEDIDISMEDGVLSIAGERQTEKHDEANGVRRFERVSGRFYRRFSLPDTADAEGIKARSANGILEVTIPKLPEVQPRRITVETR